MQFPSVTQVLGTAFVLYTLNLMWSLLQLSSTIKCTQTPCYTSFLATDPKLQVLLFTSPTTKPSPAEFIGINVIFDFNATVEQKRNFDVGVPYSSRENGTLFLHVLLVYNDDNPVAMYDVPLTEYMIPKNALGDEVSADSGSNSKAVSIKPITHFKTEVFISILTDTISMSKADIPPEMGHLIRLNDKNEYLPIIIETDFRRTTDMIEVHTHQMSIAFNYSPISSIDKLRIQLLAESVIRMLHFNKRDGDEFKVLLLSTNVYLLCGTVFVGGMHVLFELLSIKNEVFFWRRKRGVDNLSGRTTLWRGLSQTVIFLYLYDEHISMIVLISAGIGALIALWKCTKFLKITRNGLRIKTTNESESVLRAVTKAIDPEVMRNFSYVLYPLCICGSVYSLLYEPHLSWYSWTLKSIVNVIYAFGFLILLPQLVLNYKLKSVEALPWHACIYNTLTMHIHCAFACIVTMPTAHRLTYFSGVIVSIIHLYQRWLYPVDESRLDDRTDVLITEKDATATDESEELHSADPSAKEKKTN